MTLRHVLCRRMPGAKMASLHIRGRLDERMMVRYERVVEDVAATGNSAPGSGGGRWLTYVFNDHGVMLLVRWLYGVSSGLMTSSH